MRLGDGYLKVPFTILCEFDIFHEKTFGKQVFGHLLHAVNIFTVFHLPFNVSVFFNFKE